MSETITWTYGGDGQVNAKGSGRLFRLTPEVLAHALRLMTSEAVQTYFDEWWDKPFTLSVTSRFEGDEEVLSATVEDVEDIRGPAIITLYCIHEMTEGGSADDSDE